MRPKKAIFNGLLTWYAYDDVQRQFEDAFGMTEPEFRRWLDLVGVNVIHARTGRWIDPMILTFVLSWISGLKGTDWYLPGSPELKAKDLRAVRKAGVALDGDSFRKGMVNLVGDVLLRIGWASRQVNEVLPDEYEKALVRWSMMLEQVRPRVAYDYLTEKVATEEGLKDAAEGSGAPQAGT